MDTAFSGTEESRIVPTTGFRLAEHNGQDWPLVEECQRIASRNLSLSFTGYPSAFSLMFLLSLSLSLLQVSSLVSPLGLPRCWLVPLLLHHLSTPLGGRTNGRAKLAARGFPIFHQEVGFKYLCPLSLSLSARFFWPRLHGIKLLPPRIDVSRCKFVLFFTAYHPAPLVSADLPACR